MFEGNVIFIVIKEDDGTRVVKKLILDRRAQKSICRILDEGINSLLDQTLEEVELSVGYRPDES